MKNKLDILFRLRCLDFLWMFACMTYKNYEFSVWNKLKNMEKQKHSTFFVLSLCFSAIYDASLVCESRDSGPGYMF